MTKFTDYNIFISPYKSGSTSLGMALSILGYKDMSWNPNLFTNEQYILISDSNRFSHNYFTDSIYNKTNNSIIQDLKKILYFVKELSANYNSFSDSPIGHEFIDPVLKKIIWENAKFIFVQRPINDWIISTKKHYKYPYDISDEYFFKKRELYISRYKLIEKFFPKDVLYYELGSGWGKICDFLNKKIPNQEFPHINKTT